MNPRIELPVNMLDLPDLGESEKDELILEAVKNAGQCLLFAMLTCKVPNYIEGAFEDGFGNKYDLMLRRRKGASGHA